jgi:hypothetical protein
MRRQQMVSISLPALRTKGICAQLLSGRGQRGFMMDSFAIAADL